MVIYLRYWQVISVGIVRNYVICIKQFIIGLNRLTLCRVFGKVLNGLLVNSYDLIGSRKMARNIGYCRCRRQELAYERQMVVG